MGDIFSFDAFNYWQSIVGDFIDYQINLFFDTFIELWRDILHLNSKGRRCDCILVENLSDYSDAVSAYCLLLGNLDSSSLNIDWYQITRITKWVSSDQVDSRVLPNRCSTRSFRLELSDIQIHIGNISKQYEVWCPLSDGSNRCNLLNPFTPTNSGDLWLIDIGNSNSICKIGKGFRGRLKDWRW